MNCNWNVIKISHLKQYLWLFSPQKPHWPGLSYLIFNIQSTHVGHIKWNTVSRYHTQSQNIHQNVPNYINSVQAEEKKNQPSSKLFLGCFWHFCSSSFDEGWKHSNILKILWQNKSNYMQTSDSLFMTTITLCLRRNKTVLQNEAEWTGKVEIKQDNSWL